MELLLRIVLQYALREATNIFPPLKLRVFVDDTTPFMIGRNEELVESAEKVLDKLKERLRRRAWSCRSRKKEQKERAK